jgi:hypothetical protein
VLRHAVQGVDGLAGRHSCVGCPKPNDGDMARRQEAWRPDSDVDRGANTAHVVRFVCMTVRRQG